MSAGIGSGCERGPGHRRLGGACGGDAGETPLLREPRQIGELASREQPRNDSGLQTIQTNNDDLFDGSVLDVQSCIAERPVTGRPTITHNAVSLKAESSPKLDRAMPRAHSVRPGWSLFWFGLGQDPPNNAAAEHHDATAEHHDDAHGRRDYRCHGHHRLRTNISEKHAEPSRSHR